MEKRTKERKERKEKRKKGCQPPPAAARMLPMLVRACSASADTPPPTWWWSSSSWTWCSTPPPSGHHHHHRHGVHGDGNDYGDVHSNDHEPVWYSYHFPACVQPKLARDVEGLVNHHTLENTVEKSQPSYQYGVHQFWRNLFCIGSCCVVTG